jgi:histidine triad (HIT) family protein
MSSQECIFCKIASGAIPAEKLADGDIIAFRDLNPQAPTHLLVIPRKHIATLNDLEPDDAELIGQMFLTARTLASEAELAESGYRTVFNCNRDAGQEVFHIHLHVLGGRKFGWPPG